MVAARGCSPRGTRRGQCRSRSIAALALWLLLLFYLLGDITGIMLLPPGNSAPDVLSRVVAVPGTCAAGARRGRSGRGSTFVAVRWPRRCDSMRSGVLAEVPCRRRGRRLRGEGRRFEPASTMRACGSATRSWWGTDGRRMHPCPCVRWRLDACYRPGRTCSYSVLL